MLPSSAVAVKTNSAPSVVRGKAVVTPRLAIFSALI